MGSKYISHTLRVIAYLWVFFPLTYLLYALLGMSVDSRGLVKIALSPSYWIVSAIAISAGFGVLRVQWYGWYLFLASNLLVAYQTAIVLVHFSDSEHKFVLFTATVAIELALLYIVAREVRVPYFFPRIRWWESDPRYKLSLQSKIIRQDATEFEGLIMDISLGGCFIKTHGNFAPDEIVSLDFIFFDRTLKCQGRIVWRSESTVTHPKGIGVKFMPLDKETIFSLRHGIRKLRRLARVYTQIARERNWRDYLQREQRYQGKLNDDESKND